MRPAHQAPAVLVCISSCCYSQVIAKASDAFSAGDIVNKRVRQFQSWSLMPFAAVVGSVFPAAYMRGSRETFGLFPGEMNFPRYVSSMHDFHIDSPSDHVTSFSFVQVVCTKMIER